MTSALPLAIVAGIYPLGLAIVVRYLGDPPSLRHAFAYLGGAATVTVGAGVAIVVTLRLAELPGRQERTLSAGLQTFLGAALLLLALWVARHRATAIHRPSRGAEAASQEADRSDRSDRSDAARAPTPQENVGGLGAAGTRTIFLVGVTTYLPSAFYIAALRNLAEAHSGVGITILSMFVCAALVLLMVELPIALRLLAPRQTGRILAAYNAWMNRHGWNIVLLIATASGLYFLANGVVELLTSGQ
ncbi:GAP family protein [Pseudofrankia asymbiotica]|uniref:GAP family protein n=1 Tax=Pseudofrankia asymbiotica TaxID=1834516 RepID=A0A1V2IER1_9ACTN|nr:GAP family protein [Pseudofrankia asymbiotica]ONH31683.1 hypothetical protein BL253_08435 [Pseudofrankia asymbiotica]